MFGACRRQRVVGGAAEPAQRHDRVGEQVAGVREMLGQRRQFGQQPIQRVVVLGDDRQQSVRRVDRVGDVVGLLVQLVGERVQLAQEVADLVRPARATMLKTSFWITSRFGIPPPRRIDESAASTRSVVGNADAFFNGIVSPLPARPSGRGGEASSTCCEPRRLVWPIFAVAFFGSLTLALDIQRQRRRPSSSARSPVTVPTSTSATRTRLLTLSANVSGICT